MDDWRDEFRSGLVNLLDRAVVSGARQADVLQVAVAEIERLRRTDERDPSGRPLE